MKLTKQQLRSIIKEELSPAEKGTREVVAHHMGTGGGLHPAISKAIESLASIFVRVNVGRGALEDDTTTLAERLIDGVEELVMGLEDELKEFI